jgi:Xaa-Pro aminopeptidase
VGAFLNVHEGPAGISKRARADEATLVKGMVLSNEPGYYCRHDDGGGFGIRIENLYEVRDAEVDTHAASPSAGEDGGASFLKFSALTVVPIQQTLIQIELLSATDREWIDSYHAHVRETLAPLLQRKYNEKRRSQAAGAEADADAVAAAGKWLFAATEPLGALTEAEARL